MHEKNLADLYGLDPIPWSRALEALESDQRDTNDTWFLATTRPDGRPHVAGVGAVWDNGKVYVVSGDGRARVRTWPRTRTAPSGYRSRASTWSSRARPNG